MGLSASSISERRRFSRRNGGPRVGINLLRPGGAVAADSVNFSEGGVCVRLEEMLEVRTPVRLQFTATHSESGGKARPVECAGRVAWVIQRLDLREQPPFLYDVGIEFVDPPPLLRRLMAQRNAHLIVSKLPVAHAAARTKRLEAASIRGRSYLPRLERESTQPSRWHLVVSVGGVPCFSGRYASERQALEAWARFKREQAKR